ncbi:poly-gamma-glutamate biosynthesis protein PgsC [Candidatus Fermentibacteria bacterium]|nr:poly-gamma-glutamate biosynthesis protein PgsC [Candidatus Fermentibacteria bacterium]
MVLESLGLGLVVSLVFSELFGLVAGGLVVPGYVALYLDRPLALVSTAVASFVTLGVIKFLSYFMFIFGRRRMVLTIIIGFLTGWALRSFPGPQIANLPLDLAPVGYIIPGLVSMHMDKQGILHTLTTLLIASVLVRLVLILVSGGAFFGMPEAM